MGQESNRTVARRQALRDQIPPSTVAGLLRMAGRDLSAPDSDETESGEGAGAVGAPPGRAGAPPGRAGGAPPGEAPVVTRAGGTTGAGPAMGAGQAIGAAAGPEPGARPATPSWAHVIATTIRLRLGRRPRGDGEPASQRGLMVGVIVFAIAIAVASGLVVALPRHATAPNRAGTASSQGAGQFGTIAGVRRQTAAWVASQVSRNVIVACDPVMCTALEGQGLAAQNLLTLQASASDPLGSDVVVATEAVRSQFGGRLASVYAPEVIASFGTGAARIDVRAIAPDGAAAYQAALGSDRLARRAAGGQLLRNRLINAGPAAARELASGQVDSRLLIMLAALAAKYPLNITAFGTPAPGASPDIPLRSVDITATGAQSAADLPQIQAFLQAQLPPYRPLRLQVLPPAAGRTILRIDFGAPSPLGLLGSHA